MAKRKTGVAEWAEHSANLFIGCEHNCRYCYARERALRFRQIKSAEDWACPRPLKNLKRYTRRVDGVIMMPTTHDITPANLFQCVAYLEEMLHAGNRVLIVTKAHVDCVLHLCERLAFWREQVEFRITCGSCNDRVLTYWEPGAPDFDSRWDAIVHALEHGYRVSVSMEPLLTIGDATRLRDIHAFLALPSLSEIWIGKMNHVRRRVQILTDEDRRRVERIEAGQTDERIMEIVEALKDEPKIRFKDSIQEVIDRNRQRKGK